MPEALCINKTCGTCYRWEVEIQPKRPASIRTMNNGSCLLSGKEQKAGAVENCWYWKEADQEELVRRGYLPEGG